MAATRLIRVTEETRSALKAQKGLGITYDAVIANLLAFREEHVGADRPSKEE